MINLHDYVAILIDCENVQLSYIEQVLKISEYYGRLEKCQAYGNWGKPALAPWSERVDRLNIDRIPVNDNGKNATDNRLLVGIGEILENFWGNSVSIFIIVSGDGDFTSACEYIQEKGAQVIIIGNKQQTSKSLKEKFKHYYVEDLDDELSKLAKLHPISPNELRSFYDLLFRAYISLSTKKYNYDWVPYNKLGTKLHEIVPDYKSKFGKYPLSEWLKNFEKDFEINENMIRRIDTAPEMTRLGLIYKAYLQTQQGDRSHLGEFGKALRKLAPDYESRFGSKTLTEWLEDYPDRFKRLENYVYLVR